MKLGNSTASFKVGTGQARGLIPPTDTDVPPEGTYALLEPTGDWATWAADGTLEVTIP